MHPVSVWNFETGSLHYLEFPPSRLDWQAKEPGKPACFQADICSGITGALTMPSMFYMDCGGATQLVLLPSTLSTKPCPQALHYIYLISSLNPHPPNIVPNMKHVCKEWGGVGREDSHNDVVTPGWPQSTSDMRTPFSPIVD